MSAVLPNNIEAEKSVLHCMINSENAILEALEIIHPDDFYFGSHGAIMQAIKELFHNSIPIDFITIINHLSSSKNEIKPILDEIRYFDSNISNIKEYCNIIKDKSILRQLINTSETIYQKSISDSINPQELLQEMENSIFEISSKTFKRNFVDMEDIGDEFDRDLNSIIKSDNHIIGVPSGLKSLDKITLGFQHGELIIIAGRPSMGKTELAINIAENLAYNNIPVGLFSLEMSKKQLAIRIYSALTNIAGYKFKTGMLTTYEMNRYTELKHRINKMPLYIDDTAGLSIIELQAKSKKLKIKIPKLQLILIDYIQLMSGDKKGNREQEISSISRGLKILAKDLDIPVIALSQLSRKCEEREDKKPILSDLRESGSIEQDADVVIFTYSDAYYERDKEKKKELERTLELLVSKNRNGQTGDTKIVNDKNIQKLSDDNLEEF